MREERAKSIAQYAAGYVEVMAALEGISAAELDWKPAPKEWSAREVVHHLADSEMIAAVRLRRMLVEDEAQILPYDPDDLARGLHYAVRPHAIALTLFQAVRAETAQLLESLADVDWERAAQHPRTGRYSVEQWLRDYAGHAHEHADQIRANRRQWGIRGREAEQVRAAGGA
jgi:DinB superfamily